MVSRSAKSNEATVNRGFHPYNGSSRSPSLTTVNCGFREGHPKRGWREPPVKVMPTRRHAENGLALSLEDGFQPASVEEVGGGSRCPAVGAGGVDRCS